MTIVKARRFAPYVDLIDPHQFREHSLRHMLGIEAIVHDAVCVRDCDYGQAVRLVFITNHRL